MAVLSRYCSLFLLCVFCSVSVPLMELDDSINVVGQVPLTKTRRSADKPPKAAEQESKIRLGPQLLRAGDHGVGRLAVDATFSDLSGKRLRVGQLVKDHRTVVIAMTSTSCPLSQKYFPTLLNLARTYSPRGVGFVIVNPVSTDDEKAMQKAQAALGTDAAYVFDRRGSLADALGAKTTTDVIVVDGSRTVVYHGAVDDQYGFGFALEAPRKTFLADALDAILDRRVPVIEATAAPGCRLAVDKKRLTVKDITYHGRISRLIQRQCVDCHRDGGVAPFPLDSYKDVVSHAPMIREVVNRGIMPPWFAAAPKDGQPNLWANDRSLARADKEDLLAWIEGDQAAGDVSDAPKARVFSDEWQIGKPDAVFAFDEPVPVKATGFMPYKSVTVETNLDEDKWVEAVEVQPGERAVVHHVLVFARPPVTEGQDRSSRRRQSNGINYWAVYVPGNGAQVYPEGYGRLLLKGSRLTFQMHYTPNGTATEDRTRIGFIFADKPPKHEVKTTSIVNHRFKIPPGADNHQVIASISIPADVQVLGYLSHSHLRGKAARYELISEDGESELLLDIPRYDFNWQLFYQYAEPRTIKRGSTIRYTAWYDNSSGNPANPDPTQTVRWGNQTHDEMHLGYVEYTVLATKPGVQSGQESPRRRQDTAFAAIDTNRDGEISRNEIRRVAANTPIKRQDAIFDRFDADASGTLNEAEYNRLRQVLRLR